MPFGRIGKFVAMVLAVALFHATIPQVSCADAPPPMQQEQRTSPVLPSEQELAEMRLAEMEAPTLQQFEAGAVIPLVVIITLSVVAVVTLFWLVILPEKESPSVPDGYPRNVQAPEVNPDKNAVCQDEVDQLEQQAAANPGLGNFAAGR